jgi:hypothetical protein
LGGAPPPSERKTLQTHGSGYAIAVEPAAVDAVRSERGLAALETDNGGAAEDRAALLRLWRRRAFDELGEWPPAVLERESSKKCGLPRSRPASRTPLHRGEFTPAARTEHVPAIV